MGKGIARPVSPLTLYAAAVLQNAIRTAQAKGQTAKTDITIGAEDTVSLHLSVRNTLQLNPNAAYVIIDVLGGIDRSVTLYIAKSRAKHLSFLSRSGLLDIKRKDSC
jgi:hypothetical protein